MKTKNFEVFLPVWKQGCDLASHLKENEDNPVKSFQGLADQYVEAARMCNRISEVLSMEKDLSQISVQADTHHISINAPEKMMAMLVQEKLVEEEIWDDDEEEDLIDDEEDDNEKA